MGVDEKEGVICCVLGCCWVLYGAQVQGDHGVVQGVQSWVVHMGMTSEVGSDTFGGFLGWRW